MKRIKAVIDTNILVSGIISPRGAPRKVLELARKENFRVVSSVLINHEVLRVLHRDYIYAKYNLTEELL